MELWSHKLRSALTLTLLTLGVFALVVLTSVLDGVLDKVARDSRVWPGTAPSSSSQGAADDGRA